MPVKRYEYDCALCGAHYKTEFHGLTVCPKCREKLPHCGWCGRIMGRRYGYWEDFARKVGKLDICTSCNYEIINKGFLHLEPSRQLGRKPPPRFMLPDGTIVNKMPKRLN